MKTMHLFAGGGGGLLADLILGHTPIVAVEWDKYACDILRERAKDGWFNGLHVWEGDVRLFDPSDYTDRVDIIHAGFPCQDISQAGKKAGLGEGNRSGLYREVLRIAGVVRPKIIFLENVSAILSNGLGTVLADLAEMGFHARWCCIKASDVGAPHQRDRWWLRAERIEVSPQAEHDRDGWGKQQQTSLKKTAELANADSIGHIHSQAQFNTAERWKYALGNFAASRDDVADTRCELWQERNATGLDTNTQERTHSELHNQSGSEGFFSNTNSTQRKGKRKSIGVHQEHSEPVNTCWWEAEPSICRVANGVANWSHRLKALGNGQVPLQAALAFKLLEG